MLSDTAIRKAKPAAKSFKLPDERGLHLLVRPNGAKLWQLRYRFLGKEKTASLGQYPDVTLAQARDERDRLRRMVAQGTDPVAAKRAAKAAQQAAEEHTFEIVARRWFDHWKGPKHPRHTAHVLARLEGDVFPVLGHVAVANVDAPQLVAMVKRIEARGALELAKRSLQMCGQVFRYAIAHGIGGVTRNPAADIRPADVIAPRRKEHYARVDARELPALLRRIEAYKGTPTTRLAMKLLALTFVRTGELIGARWSEFDLGQARWDIPAGRMKMRAPHIVPLSVQAVEVLQTLHEVTGHCDLLFPGERDHARPMSNNTILAALERMGYKGRMTGHGFRGLASTILHEQGFDHAHIELQLAHQERDDVSAAYNFATYLEQRGAMMQWWGDFLDAQLRGNVVALQRRAA